MIDILLPGALLGIVLTLGLCAIRRHRKPPLWLSLLSAALTGMAVLLFYFGPSLFTTAFWSGGKGPNWVVGVAVFGLSGIASLVVSVVVVFLWRLSRDETA
jgi:hypothetical protein